MDLLALAPQVERAFRDARPSVVAAFARPPAPGAVTWKEDRTVVTDLDLLLEERIGRALLELTPTCGLVGEERGEVRAGRPTWHLDPLDGTLNFSRRIPLFASQAVLLDGDEPLFAAVYDPLRDDFAWAARGQGAWREGRRLAVSRRPLHEALLIVDVSRTGPFVVEPTLLGRLRRAVHRVRVLGSIGVHLREVASGAADAYYGGRRRPSRLHDMAPGVLLVREAGGVASDGAGGDPFADRRRLLAAGPDLHAALLRILAGSD